MASEGAGKSNACEVRRIQRQRPYSARQGTFSHLHQAPRLRTADALQMPARGKTVAVTLSRWTCRDSPKPWPGYNDPV